jgi:carlactone synthase / all-trans-10'-apo-beta-carotenal 13,14-cleaving dioxygenase
LFIEIINRVGRFRIPLDGSPYGTLEAALDPNEHGKGMDMCSINPNYLGLKYRYAYACGAQRPCNFPNTLTKVTFLYMSILIISVEYNPTYI